MAAQTIKPDLAIAVDVCVPYDIPGMSGQTSETALGNGPVVIMMDASSIAHQGLRQHIKEVAKSIISVFNGILHQVVVPMPVVFTSQMKAFQLSQLV